jgi:hypothetical protein
MCQIKVTCLITSLPCLNDDEGLHKRNKAGENDEEGIDEGSIGQLPVLMHVTSYRHYNS